MTTKIPRIDRMIKKAQRYLKLSSYEIKYFLKENMDNSEYGEIICDLPKRKAVINLNTRRLNDDLEDTIIHELLHLFFYKYLGVAEDAFERQKKFKSLKKYREGEEGAIKILTSLLKRSIFSKNTLNCHSRENGNPDSLFQPPIPDSPIKSGNDRTR